MTLTDAVSSLHLTIFAEVPLLIFLGIFIGVCAHMLSRDSAFERAALLPLHDEREPTGGREP